jgi:hypothetical protein
VFVRWLCNRRSLVCSFLRWHARLCCTAVILL